MIGYEELMELLNSNGF